MSSFTVHGLAKQPVYIMSPMQRCGTNHLADILLLHPDFQLPAVLEEDFVFEHANLLTEYCERTYARWKRLGWIEQPEEYRRVLENHLGQAILSLLIHQIDADKRPLFKTPDSSNIEKFFLFLPEARLLLLMRDGRDVVDSAVRKWPGRPAEYWMQRWAMGARRILDFMHGTGCDTRGKSWDLIYYEELVQRPQTALKGVLEFLGIDGLGFAWDKLTHLPVRGSSAILDAQGRVSQEAVAKPKAFNPIGRWQDWSRWRKRKFKKIAGRELVQLGYESSDHW